MKIGIIGAGQIGGTLTRRFTALGHEVAVAKRVCRSGHAVQANRGQYGIPDPTAGSIPDAHI